LFKLIIEDDEGHTTVVPLVKEEITIGRKEGNTIRLTERNVSRHHARLTRSNGSVFIEDLDSYNGVKVNGDKITARTTVREGDLVEIGDYHLALQKSIQEGLSAPPPTPSPESGPPPISAAQARAATQSDGATAVMKLPVEDKKDPDSGRIRNIPTNEAGRLMITTTELSGAEFPLVRTEMIIGRTDDCDIQISHRSISSRHAKIVFDGGIYRIIDLDSANGVLVNGEEYARVDLRRGDKIELGHIKIRYVAPGEVYQPDDAVATTPLGRSFVDAAAVEAKTGTAGKKIGLIFAGLAVIGLVGFGVYHFTQTTEKTDDGKVEPIDDTDTKPTPPVPKEDPAAAFFKDGMEKLKIQEYDAAIVAFSTALEENPEYPGAKSMLEKAKTNKEEAGFLADAKIAIEKKNWDKAWESLEQIPADSRFAKEIDQLKPEVKKKYISVHLNKAKKYRDSRLFDNALKHADSVLFVDEGNTYAAELKKSIKKMRESKRKPDRVAIKPKEPTVKKTGTKRKKKEAADLVKKANNFYRKKKPNDAIKHFEQAIELDPRNCDAVIGLGISYATLGRGAQAAKYYRKFVKICPRDMRAPRVRETLKQFDSKRKGI
jgi:pSer/pThr/pTyr-binding forkhead associated (FHA) protein/tetratricopeptide (TPR) repeat protein